MLRVAPLTGEAPTARGLVGAPVGRGRVGANGAQCAVGVGRGGYGLGMGGLPDDVQGRDVSGVRALARIERDGRPMRMSTLCAALGLAKDSWREMSREAQVEAMEPFIDHAVERWHWSNAGELFIVDQALGGAGVSPITAGKSLEQLQERRLTERKFDRFVSKLTRESFNQAFATATMHLAPLLVELDERVIVEGLAADASDAEKDRAMKAAKDLKDRLGGKSVQATEDVGGSGAEDIRRFVASRRPDVLPASAHVSVQQVGEVSRREIEAGGLEAEGDDA